MMAQVDGDTAAANCDALDRQLNDARLLSRKQRRPQRVEAGQRLNHRPFVWLQPFGSKRLHGARNGVYGMEMSEVFCDVMINRWQAFSGKIATLAADNQSYADVRAERVGAEKAAA